MNLSDLKQKSSEELAKTAAELGIDNASSLRRQDLVFAILRVHGQRREEIHADGVLEVLSDGFGFLRAADANYLPGPDDVYVSPSQIRRFDLRTGDTVGGLIRAPKETERYFALLKVETINGRPPDRRGESVFDNLVPVHPSEPLTLERPDDLIGRTIDLICPLGKGQRCLVVAPPRSGRTALLTSIARSIETNHPDIEVLVLLVDERPEEVTAMRRAIESEVVASTFDEAPARHVQVADIAIERAKRIVEDGGDAMILVDSLSRLVRAHNATTTPSGRVFAGDLDAAALHKPKRFFGAARATEENGSLTIVATALSETGSALDDVVLEELAGTANCEIILSAELRDRRVFPAIDVLCSATRNDELLLGDRSGAVEALRRELAKSGDPVDAAETLHRRLAESTDNDILLS